MAKVIVDYDDNGNVIDYGYILFLVNSIDYDYDYSNNCNRLRLTITITPCLVTISTRAAHWMIYYWRPHI